MKRVVWTVAVALGGLFLANKGINPMIMSMTEIIQFVVIGAGLGALVGFGFGSVFSTKNWLRRLLYWMLTCGLLGALFGFDSPMESKEILFGALVGALVGLVLGAIHNAQLQWSGGHGNDHLLS